MYKILYSDPKPEPAFDYAAPQDALRTLVEELARPRSATHEAPENERCRGLLARRLDRLGYHVSLEGPHQNVLALPRGYAGEPLTLVGAHYDSVPGSPGADDNASALAALLSCAAYHAGRRHPPRVAFVAFNREEEGLLGSADFVRRLGRGAGPSIRRAHILEMVGYTGPSQRGVEGLPFQLPRVGDFLGLVGDTQSGVEGLVQLARGASPELHVLGVELSLYLAQRVHALHRSDHAPFWAAGRPAILWTDTAEHRNPHYHRPSDLPETLDYAFLQRVTELLIAACG